MADVALKLQEEIWSDSCWAQVLDGWVVFKKPTTTLWLQMATEATGEPINIDSGSTTSAFLFAGCLNIQLIMS